MSDEKHSTPREQVIVPCEMYGTTFIKNATDTRQRFCSRECGLRSARLRRKEGRKATRVKKPRHKSNFGEKKCELCGKSYASTRANRRYCSHECYLEAQRIRLRGKYTPVAAKEKEQSKDSLFVIILKRIIQILERKAK